MGSLSKNYYHKLCCLLSVSCLFFLFGCSQKKDIEAPPTITNQEILIDSIPSEKPLEIIPIQYDYDTLKWSEFTDNEFFILDLKYATENNFMKQQIYDCPRCFLARHMADSLRSMALEISAMGYKLVLLDCYRPRPYQQKLWDIKPDARFVTNPAKGSMHNRGVAIDLGLADMDGNQLDMGSAYDHFGRESYYLYEDLSPEVKERRVLLRSMMEKHGMNGIRTEWWHFSIKRNAPKLSDWLWPCGE